MRRWSQIAAVTLALVLATLAPDAWAELTVNVTANRTQVYLGESVLLSVEVRGANEIEPPDLSRIAGATVTPRGSRSQNSIQYSMSSGGSPTLLRQFGRDFIYELTPTNTGSFVAGPVSVRAGGQSQTVVGPAIYVMGVEAQNWVKVSVSASREAVLVDEAFEIELSIGLRQLHAPYNDHDPVSPQDPPRISAPFLNVAPIDGLAGPNIQEMLQRLLVSRGDQPGFAINDFSVRADPFDSMFNLGAFMEQRAARFKFPRRTVPGPQGTYHVYTLQLKYVAKKEGNYTFGPVELKGQPIIDVAPGGQVVTRPVFAVGPAVVVRVVPPPEEGRPASFIGAIGSNLVVSASLDTQTCNVGDPLTLTLSVSGDISLDNMRPPVLGEQPPLAQRFRIYDDTVQVHSRPGGKLYSYTLRPTQAGTYELPPIAVSYYDVRERAYHTAYTDPIPLRANESAQVGGSMILSASTNRAAQRMSFSATSQARQVSPITLDPAGAESAPLLVWPLHGTLALAGPAILLLAGASRGVRQLLWRRAGASRPRGAKRAALAILNRAAREPDRRRSQAGARTALAVYVGDRLKAPTTGLAPSDMQRLLMGHGGVPADLIVRTVDLYERLFLAEFANAKPVEVGADTALADARALIQELDRVIATAPREQAARLSRSSGKKGGLLALALLCTATPRAGAQPEAEHRFMWDQANARVAAAQTPADFADAAGLYHQMILQGVRNAPLFYNYGVALLEAERIEDAARAFQRAERFAGNDADVRQNLAVALARNSTPDLALLPWYRVFLFWHYGLDLSTRVAAALAGFSLLCLSLALRMWKLRTTAVQLHGVAVALMVIFGSSVGASLHAESRDQTRERALRTIEAKSAVAPATQPHHAAPHP